MSNEPDPSRQQGQGSLFVISAPSGAGKTTLCKEIIDKMSGLRHSVSFTTRQKRAGEEEGVDYHFVSPETFRSMVAQGKFAEWAEVHGNLYGTAIDTLDEIRATGCDVLLDVDIQGAAQLKKTYGHGVFIFILPPSFDELRRRLEGRRTDAPEIIERRIGNARREIREALWYDYLIVNDDFPQALEKFTALVVSERCRTPRVLSEVGKCFDLQVDPK